MGYFKVICGFGPYDKALSSGRILPVLENRTAAKAFAKASIRADSISLIRHIQIQLLEQLAKHSQNIRTTLEIQLLPSVFEIATEC